MSINNLRPKVFVEPFAGGAAVALQLLSSGLVENIALGERDPLLASFWRVVFRDSDWLIRQIQKVDVSVRNWKHFRSTIFRSDKDRALACFFLNRTSFSGILARSAGPIGGLSQESAYTIDCRFPVKTLVKRIRQVAELSDRVLFVRCGNWEDTLQHVESLGFRRREIFYYFDPPFYAKAKRLYNFCFDAEDHRRLHDTLVGLRQPWLLSYDPAKPILTMYSENGNGPKRVELLYSASGNGGMTRARELIITNLPLLPRRVKLWGLKSGNLR